MDLTDTTVKLIIRLFKPENRAEAFRLMRMECSENLPYPERHEAGCERIRFAALKVSEGDLYKLIQAIATARGDWRALLAWAGFGGNPDAHTKWAESILSSHVD